MLKQNINNKIIKENIDSLNDDESFTIYVRNDNETFTMTKKDFYETFLNVFIEDMVLLRPPHMIKQYETQKV